MYLKKQQQLFVTVMLQKPSWSKGSIIIIIIRDIRGFHFLRGKLWAGWSFQFFLLLDGLSFRGCKIVNLKREQNTNLLRIFDELGHIRAKSNNFVWFTVGTNQWTYWFELCINEGSESEHIGLKIQIGHTKINSSNKRSNPSSR